MKKEDELIVRAYTKYSGYVGILGLLLVILFKAFVSPPHGTVWLTIAWILLYTGSFLFLMGLCMALMFQKNDK